MMVTGAGMGDHGRSAGRALGWRFAASHCSHFSGLWVKEAHPDDISMFVIGLILMAGRRVCTVR